jgi:hypothetical protein
MGAADESDEVVAASVTRVTGALDEIESQLPAECRRHDDSGLVIRARRKRDFSSSAPIGRRCRMLGASGDS